MSGFKYYFDKFLGKKEITEEERLSAENRSLPESVKTEVSEQKKDSKPQDSLILEKTDINNQIVNDKPRKHLFSHNKKTENVITEDKDPAVITVNKNLLLIWMLILIILSVFISFLVARKLFFGGFFIDNSNKVSFSLEGSDNYTLSKLQSVITAVENEFYPGADKNVIAEGAIQGIVDALGDRYTVYYKPGTMDTYKEIINGEYQGMGAVVKGTDTGLEVTSVYEDTPAYKAGIIEGDIITAINEQSTLGMESLTLRELLGTGGNELSMKIMGADGKEKNVSLTIDTVKVQTVFSQPEGNGIYRITITQFDSDTGNEFYTKLTEVINQGCRALVIDLRNNGGGYESEAVKITDMLLPEGVIATSKDKNGKVIKEILSEKSELDMPLAILVNGNTASASELLTGAVKDFGKGKIVGSRTFGKAVGQIQISFEKDGSGLVITTACYYTPSGKCIQGEGITPDFHVELPEEYKDTAIADIPSAQDNQLQKALELITSELE